MAEQRYRFGGPVPESVQTLRARRRYRGSESFATLKKNRRQDFWESPPPGWVTERDGMGFAVGIKRFQSPCSPVEKERARAVLAPFKRHDAPAATALLPLCAWRIEGQDFSRPGFTTDFEQVKFWVRRGAVVTALHQPSEDGKSRTVSGAVVVRLAEVPTDPWGCPLSESASTAAAESQAPVMRCGSHSPSACPSGCGARNPDPVLSAPDRLEEIAARARDFRQG